MTPSVDEASGFDLSVPLYAISHRRIGGTEPVVYNLVRGLQQNGTRLFLGLPRDGRLDPAFVADVSSVAGWGYTDRLSIGGRKNNRFLEECLFRFASPRDTPVLFPNYFVSPWLEGRKGGSFPILHDIQYRTLPSYHSARRRRWLDAYLPVMFRLSRRVLLVSKSEHDLVARHFGEAAARKCRILGNAVDFERLASGPIDDEVRARLDRPFILSVFHPFPHKNVETLLKAFAALAKPSHRDVFLYLAGNISRQVSDAIEAFAPPDVRQRIVSLGYVTDAELGALYRAARIFALPSLYEGFGVPAVEALGSGAPTLVSGTTALPEVTLGLARYVSDPLDPGAWTEQLAAMLDEAGRVSDADAATLRERYRPATIARRLMDIVRES